MQKLFLRRGLLSSITAMAVVIGLSACETLTLNDGLEVAAHLVPAVLVTDDQIIEFSRAGVAEQDQKHQVAAAQSPYHRRLMAITQHKTLIDGHQLNYKVYLSDTINAFAAPDGSIRVFSGLMDHLNDDELAFVIGHEIGHVVRGHSQQQFRAASLTSGGRRLLGVASQGALRDYATSDLGQFVELMIRGQFSQAHEHEADDYGLQMLRRFNRPPTAAASALDTLASFSQSTSMIEQMIASHPEPRQRAARIRARL